MSTNNDMENKIIIKMSQIAPWLIILTINILFQRQYCFYTKVVVFVIIFKMSIKRAL